jgi:hypothetical protein
MEMTERRLTMLVVSYWLIGVVTGFLTCLVAVTL